MIKFETKYTHGLISDAEREKMLPKAEAAYNELISASGAGSEYTDWLRLPLEYDQEEFAAIKAKAAEIREKSDVLVCIGIGGSYLGAKAVTDALLPYFKQSGCEVIYAGHNLSSDYLAELRDYLKDKDYHLNIISKSGTTTEPAISFRVLLEDLKAEYGDKAGERVIATTDKAKGALREMVDEEGWTSFVVPDGIGGRYSVLTPVGLLPIYAAGIDCEAIMRGAASMQNELLEGFKADHPAIRYAVERRILYDKGFRVEILAAYESKLRFFLEWWKQLFGESEGKDGKGIFPASVLFTDDLHSLGQFIQEGSRNLLYLTHINIVEPEHAIKIEKSTSGNKDGLDYLAGKFMHEVNFEAMHGTEIAHASGNTPSMRLSVDKIDERHIGEMIYFFEFVCGISAYMSSVNPFDQPGVESYKNNMFALLGKESHVELAEKLRNADSRVN